MMWISVCIAVLVGTQTSYIKGKNILLGKPTRSTGSFGKYPASQANDGVLSKRCYLFLKKNPFWESDLLGVYSVSSITVSNVAGSWANFLKGVSIGVSIDRRHVTLCGVFPFGKHQNSTFTCTCKGSGNVRYVKLWKKAKRYQFGIAEISAKGVKTEFTYDRRPLLQVKRSSLELSARSYIHCGVTCTTRAVCLAFSYSSLQDPNCRLSDQVSTERSPNWTTGLVSDREMEAFHSL